MLNSVIDLVVISLLLLTSVQILLLLVDDARHSLKYRMLVSMVDVIFSDVTQPNQARIAQYFLKNMATALFQSKLTVSIQLLLQKLYLLKKSINWRRKSSRPMKKKCCIFFFNCMQYYFSCFGHINKYIKMH